MSTTSGAQYHDNTAKLGRDFVEADWKNALGIQIV
jgi:hypothetical protein